MLIVHLLPSLVHEVYTGRPVVTPFQCVAWRLFILPACIFSEGKTTKRLHAKLHLSFSLLLYVDSLLVKTPVAYCSRQGVDRRE